MAQRRQRYAPPDELPQILVDPAPLLALRAMLDQVLTGAADQLATAPAALLQLKEPQWGSGDSRPWVAEVVIMRSGSFERSFLRGRRDYSAADKKGRGIKICYVLRPGIVYEVHEVTYRREERYFCRVRDGEIERLEPEEAQRWADGLHFVDAHCR